MSHSHCKIWVHVVIGVKYRDPVINFNNEFIIHKIIKREVKKTGCSLIAINGTNDHVHLLIKLHPVQSISAVMKQIKGASSRMISRLSLCKNEFYWQVGYGAFSVSDKDIKGTIHYIRQQKVHHRKFSYTQELKRLNKC